jgi:hypothetical protein
MACHSMHADLVPGQHVPIWASGPSPQAGLTLDRHRGQHKSTPNSNPPSKFLCAERAFNLGMQREMLQHGALLLRSAKADIPARHATLHA